MPAALLALLLLAPPGPPDTCKSDLAAAYDALEKECGRLLEAKGVSLGKIRKDLAKDAAAARTTEDEWVLLSRLVARLRDGHASVLPTDKRRISSGRCRRWRRGPGSAGARSPGRCT